jgi:acyl-CoA reductase-like NAD-dependent aldehyde dehydrogenase
MLTNPNTTDLQDAQTPEDVAVILRNAAQKYRESEGELAAAWGDPNAGRIWRKVAGRIDSCATSCDHLAKGL